MVAEFFITFDSKEIRRTVLCAAYYAKGGITEWLEMPTDDFWLWMKELQEVTKNVNK